VKKIQIPLEHGEAYSYPHWLDADAANHTLAVLQHEIPWSNPKIRMFGKWVAQPRLVCWMADTGCHYSCSGLELEIVPFHPILDVLRKRLEEELNLHFNSVLLNWYRDGSDSMGFHADNEPELGPDPTIASLSLGGSRDFIFKARIGSEKYVHRLHDGELLLMGTGVQQQYLHALPKRAKALPRINCTFRRIISPA
jgi:alkylated DNA repair dioxygenase AlkB